MFLFLENCEKDEDSLSFRRNVNILPIEEEGKYLDTGCDILYYVFREMVFAIEIKC